MLCLSLPLVAAEDEGDGLTRLVKALRAGEVKSAKGLDGRLVPLYRVAPVYPAALSRLPSSAFVAR